MVNEGDRDDSDARLSLGVALLAFQGGLLGAASWSAVELLARKSQPASQAAALDVFYAYGAGSALLLAVGAAALVIVERRKGLPAGWVTFASRRFVFAVAALAAGAGTGFFESVLRWLAKAQWRFTMIDPPNLGVVLTGLSAPCLAVPLAVFTIARTARTLPQVGGGVLLFVGGYELMAWVGVRVVWTVFGIVVDAPSQGALGITVFAALLHAAGRLRRQTGKASPGPA